MKRLLISIFTLCVWIFGLHAQSGEFDPANPGDPQPYYSLTVQVSPAAGGTANITRTMVEAGKNISVRITPNKNFKLQQWVCGEEILSSDTYLYYTMPARNVTITAQMVYEPEAFNPQSPDDPQGQGETAKKHLVSVYTSPSIGGYVNRSSFYMEEGTQQQLYAYNNAGYEFVGWYSGDKLESSSNPVTLTMRENDITLTARFRFNPVSPEDPGANLYDAATGTLIIDRFTSGRLSDKVYSLVGDGGYSNVKSLTVVGEMSSSDYGIVRNFSNVEVIDLSRTIGYTAVPAWAFEGLTQLQRILLPATVESIGSSAFYGCSALTEMVLYSPAPPTAQQGASSLFANVPEGLVVRVPASSATLYQANDLWKSFMILSMDVQSINVSLPEDKVALYENMFLELLDTKSGQLRRYVITNRGMYAFTNVFKETTYQLTLRNTQGRSLGQEMITFSGNDTTVLFANLLQPVDISLQVLNDKGQDVTESVTINWYNNEGQFLRKGCQLLRQIEGDVLYYQLELNEELGKIYLQPNAIPYTIQREESSITCRLKRFELISHSGLIVDSITQKPINNANIGISQILNKKHVQFYSVSTNENGLYTIQVNNASSNIHITAPNYKQKEIVLEENKLVTQQNIKLEPISGIAIVLNVRFTPISATNVMEKEQSGYNDYKNITYTLTNMTTGRELNFENNDMQLVLIDDINTTDELQLTAQSTNGKFAKVSVWVKKNEYGQLTANLPLIELGTISISSDSIQENVVGMLYDHNGKLLQVKNMRNGQISFDHLEAGNYTLIGMEQHSLYNGIRSINDYEQLSLSADTDYIIYPVTVTDGLTSSINIGLIPDLGGKIQYTGVYESVKDSWADVLKFVDVLCDGPYIHSQRNPKLHFVGSENQRVIDIEDTLESGCICCHTDK